jgi:hypothetical protein
MRNTKFAKWWPLAVLGGAGLLVLPALLGSHIVVRPSLPVVRPIVLTLSSCLSPVAIASPEGEEGDEDSTGGGDYDYSFGGDKNDVVRVGEDIEIGPDQTVDGDVVAVGGRATIRGHVKGDVVSIGGGVQLKAGCEVDGDAVVVGGVMDREEGAIVHGQNVSVATFPKGLGRWWWPRVDHRVKFSEGISPVLCIGKDLLRYLAFFVIGLVLCLAIPKRRIVVRSTLRGHFWMSLLVGFGAAIGVGVAFVLLCITCIGILVAVPGLLASIIVILASGAVAFALLGEVITRRPSGDGNSWLLSFAIGILPIFALQMIGRLLSCSDGGSSEFIGRALLGICKTASAVLIFSGFGALILSRFGKRNPSDPPAPPNWYGIPGVPMPPPPTSPGEVPPTHGEGTGQPWTPYGQGGGGQTPHSQGSGSGSTWQPPTHPRPPGT